MFGFLIAAALGACNVTQQDVIDKIRAIDLLPTSPVQDGGTVAGRSRPPQRALYEGQVVEALADPQSQAASPSADGFELNFENAPVSTVAKVILGDILGLGYVIDPRVQGTVSLASGRPVPRSEVLYVLETALRVSNSALIRDTGGYRIVPVAESVGGGNLDRRGAKGPPEPGYGITVVPLQHVSAQTLLKLLDSFATKANSLRADAGRNIIIVQGTSIERRAAVETILSFDADWMRGQSVGIYPVANSTPEPLIAELEKIMDSGEGGLSQSMVKLQPVARLNAILVVTRKPELLRTVSTWISRLDRSETASAGVKVYRVRYGEARQLARLLNEIFITGSAGAAAVDQTMAPGSGAVSMTSGPAPSVARPALTNAPQGPPGTVDPAARSVAPALDGPAAAARGTSASQPASLLPGVRITADAVNNTLLIYANQESYRLIERTLNQLDRPQMQVGIETTIAEVTLNDNLNYGVQFFLKSSDVGKGQDRGSIINSLAGSIIAQQLPGFNLLIGPAAEPRVILDALHGATDVKLLSNPSVVVLDNQVAMLQVGDQIPVTTGTATVINASNQVVSTIDYRNTGIILRVVPRINYNGNVTLDIEQEISNVTTPGSLTPTVSQRRVKSSIAVASGQTVLLAGLISEGQTRGQQGIPLLDQIPVIGGAFSHTRNLGSRTELIIFIRPQIIRDNVDAHYVAEQLRAKLTGRRSVHGPPERKPLVPTIVPGVGRPLVGEPVLGPASHAPVLR